MDTFKDIVKLPNNGTLIIPLSMAALHSYQKPSNVVQFIETFTEKVQDITNDIVFLYTDGLYLNSFDSAIGLKSKIQGQMFGHKNGLSKYIFKNKEWDPKAFHFMTWNQCLMSSPNFLEYSKKLEKLAKEDDHFLKCIQYDMGNRPLNEENIRFILEEVVMSYFLRHRKIELPKKLSDNNEWNLIAYPGQCMETEVYVNKHRILPYKQDNPFCHATYNSKENVLMDFKTYQIK